MKDVSLATQVVGLYSFPKSGNTWLRAIITGISQMPADLNRLQKFVPDTHYGPALANPWTFQERNWCFYKSHRKMLLDQDFDGGPLTTDKVIYIYRHPLDVFCSYLNFASTRVSPNAGQGLPFQYESVEALSAEELNVLFTIFLKFGTLFPRNVSFGNVFEHVGNFRKLSAETGDVHILRYEDLFDDFDTSVQKICCFLDLRDVNLKQAHATADKRTEQNGRFFWKRQKETFRNLLTERQIQRFYDRWRTDLLAMGYDDAV